MLSCQIPSISKRNLNWCLRGVSSYYSSVSNNTFLKRHVGHVSESSDAKEMCNVIGVESVDDLIKQTIPNHILRKVTDLKMHVESKQEEIVVKELHEMMQENKILTNFIGRGYHGTICPGVIMRNLLENPAWYTSYTPYQAEISQGRLEALFIYQTLVSELTGLPVANSSLLCEGTAAAEAIAMARRSPGNGKKTKFFLSENLHPQVIDVCKGRVEFSDLHLIIGNEASFNFDDPDLCGALVGYPDTRGVIPSVNFMKNTAERIHKNKGLFVVSADPLFLTLATPPAEFGADVVVGTMQRFGVPMLNGGPAAAYFATHSNNIRRMPGRIIGVSKDANGDAAYRLTLQTREQHIRLDKATSNLCTAQALLANISAMYSVYHGPKGLQNIANQVNKLAINFSKILSTKPGISILNSASQFDTVLIDLDQIDAEWFVEKMAEIGSVNIRRFDGSSSTVSISFDESHLILPNILTDLSSAIDKVLFLHNSSKMPYDVHHGLPSQKTPSDNIIKESAFEKRDPNMLMKQSIFNSISTETEMMRYLYRLQLKDISLCNSMITLGSCTMKLNSVSSLLPVSWSSVNSIHPFTPRDQVYGYRAMYHSLERLLSTITGFDACSLQPASGAQGEFAGLKAIRSYQQSIGQGHRDICVIPRSAHGTNPASAAMMGMKIHWIDDEGGIDMDNFKTTIESIGDRLSALMITYPSTHCLFDENIDKVCQIIHSSGGNVYMDGANMNAQIGLTSPGFIGADVCHLNLHKTFSIPHGGGGPGLGPICVRKHLIPFLPSTAIDRPGSSLISSAPFGQGGIAPIPWMFISMLGASGLRESAKIAILNANYMKARLSKEYVIRNLNKRCSHEFIIDISAIRSSIGITEEDIAKRLMDYGFHAPTMSWPVHHSLMIEPTESENKAELDRFCDALLQIREEMKKIEHGEYDTLDNPLKNAPHTLKMVTDMKWEHCYSRQVAAYPLEFVEARGKFWPTVRRVDNGYGDKVLIVKHDS